MSELDDEDEPRLGLPTLGEVRAAIAADEETREEMEERLDSLQYEALDSAYCRELLELALDPELLEMTRQRLVMATTPAPELLSSYRRVFSLGTPWVQSMVLRRMSALGISDEYLASLAEFSPDCGGRAVFPPFHRVHGDWQRLVATPLHPSLESSLAHDTWTALMAGPERLAAEEGLAVANFAAKAVLRRLPALAAAQSGEPFFWFERDGYSEPAEELCELLRVLGFLERCEASGEALLAAAELDDPNLRAAAVFSCVRLGLPPPERALRRTAEYPATRNELLETMAEAGLPPSELADWRTPAAFAEAALASWLANPCELLRPPRELRLAGERRVSTATGPAHVFVFEFSYEEGFSGGHTAPTYGLVGVLENRNGFAQTGGTVAETSLEAALDAAEKELHERVAVDLEGEG